MAKKEKESVVEEITEQPKVDETVEKLKIKKGTLHAEATVKKELMDHEFELNMRMKKMELEMIQQRESNKDLNKDNREMKSQDSKNRQEKEMEEKKLLSEITKKGFESSGNDVIGGGMRLGAFDPK